MAIEKIFELDTEKRNAATIDIDRVSTIEVLAKINAEDAKVAEIIKAKLPDIEKVVDLAYAAIKNGGRVIYIGAGTSGRLGVLDASECPPTYGVTPDLFQGIMAGGNNAMFKAKEGAEDSLVLGREDLKAVQLTKSDLVIGIAASGRTPYVIGALQYAKEIGAATGSVCCVHQAKISSYADAPIEVVTGAEVISGSTRMKAGTAQKLVLNMISTATMIKLGKVYENYMVDVKPSNAKLILRAKNMIREITQVSEEEAEILFEQSGGHVKTAIVMALCNVDVATAHQLLEKNEKVFDVLQNVNGN